MARLAGTYGEGDCRLWDDFLDSETENGIFARILDEVDWTVMHHRGDEVPRSIAIQYMPQVDGSIPILRFPSDALPPLSPMSISVNQVRIAAEKLVGHGLNHVLVQNYRHGNDHITEHSDKTLDIAQGSIIANVSFGAERVMTLRTKRARKNVPVEPTKRLSQSIRLPHNSALTMGLATNAKWLHGIRPNKKLEGLQTCEELAYSGSRISLTFRQAATFVTADRLRIFGQGATCKSKDGACRVDCNDSSAAASEMLRCFGAENQQSEFDWGAHYGGGFDVLKMTVAQNEPAEAEIPKSGTGLDQPASVK